MSTCWLLLGPTYEVEIVLKPLTVGSCFFKKRVCVLIFIFILEFTGDVVYISKALQERQNTCIC